MNEFRGNIFDLHVLCDDETVEDIFDLGSRKIAGVDEKIIIPRVEVEVCKNSGFCVEKRRADALPLLQLQELISEKPIEEGESVLPGYLQQTEVREVDQTCMG